MSASRTVCSNLCDRRKCHKPLRCLDYNEPATAPRRARDLCRATPPRQARACARSISALVGSAGRRRSRRAALADGAARRVGFGAGLRMLCPVLAVLGWRAPLLWRIRRRVGAPAVFRTLALMPTSPRARQEPGSHTVRRQASDDAEAESSPADRRLASRTRGASRDHLHHADPPGAVYQRPVAAG